MSERRIMAGPIGLQPEVLDLTLYAGDGMAFKLICKNASDAPINITGTVESQVRRDRLTEEAPLAVFAVDLARAAQGEILLSLTGEQTQQLAAVDPKGKFSGVWDVEWTPTGSQPRTLCQGKIDCLADVTR
jgi:hypothetical protein